MKKLFCLAVLLVIWWPANADEIYCKSDKPDGPSFKVIFDDESSRAKMEPSYTAGLSWCASSPSSILREESISFYKESCGPRAYSIHLKINRIDGKYDEIDKLDELLDYGECATEPIAVKRKF